MLKLTPSINYGTDLNFQQIRKSYDLTTNSTITDTINKAGLAHNLAFNMSATSVVYSYYRFVGKNKPIMRHVLTPSVSFSYRPLLTRNVTDPVGIDMKPVTYSVFTNSVYSSSATNSQALINFGLNNTFELKRKSEKDTITGFQKIRIIDGLSLTGNYDLLKDSMNLSNISINLRISPFKWLNIVGTSSYSLYGWVDSTNAIVSDFALKKNGRLGRTVTNSLATTLTITSKKSREII